MDSFETKSPAQPAAEDLQEQVETLRHLVVSLLVLVVVVSGTFSIYILRQLRDAHRELARIRPQVAQMTATYQRAEAPMMQTLMNKFADYGATHPDYVPILAKYGIKPAASAASAMPPSAAPAEKKK
jgi:hypothetical protein